MIKPKILINYCLLIFLSLSNFPALAEIGNGRAAFDEALKYKEQGLYREAEQELSRAVNLEPGNADYHIELASLYAARFDRRQNSTDLKSRELLQKMENELEQAVMYRPDNLVAHFNLGVVYKRQGEYEKAREEFNEVLELNPQSADAWMQLGSTYEEQGFFDEAGDMYLKAQDLDYNNPDIQAVRADLQARKAAYHNQQQMRDAYSAQQIASGLNAATVGAGQMGNYSSSTYQRDNQQSAGQALPYMTSMLVQQFMQKFRSGSSEDE